MTRALLLSLALLPLTTAAEGQRQRHFPADDDLALMLRYLVEDGAAPGAVLGVRDPDGSTRVVHYGVSGPDSVPIGSDAVFEIGSVTKTFTGTLLADMVLRGEVSLDDPVSRYLPDDVRMPSRNGRAITLLDLATHRSGLPTVPDNMRTPGREPPDWEYTVEDAYAFLSEYELPREPGAEREYSNFGFGLLAHILARAGGASFRELIRERILGPLGMARTGFVESDGVPEGAVTGHRNGEPVRYRTPWEIMDGAGGLYSTAGDLLKFADALVGPAVTDVERAVQLAAEVRVPAGEEGAGQGLGWGTSVYPGEQPVIGHGGGTTGFSARLLVMPATGTATVLLLNQYGFADDIAISLLYFDPPPAEWSRVPVARGTLAGYAGTYERADGSTSYYVRLEEEGWLTYQPQGAVRARLYARSDSSFYLLRGPWSLTFASGGQGDVTLHMAVDEREPAQQGRVELSIRKVSSEAPPPRAVAGNAGFGASWGMGIWALVGIAGVVGVALVARPIWRRRPR